MTEATAAIAKPVPEPDDLSRPFFEGGATGALMIQRCTDCGAHLIPGASVCTECMGESLEWVQAAGTGEVFTFAIMHQRYHPAFEPEIPYVIAVIQLDEGPRLNSNVIGVPPSEVRVGDRVEAVFEQVGEGVWLPKFRPLAAQ